MKLKYLTKTIDEKNEKGVSFKIMTFSLVNMNVNYLWWIIIHVQS